MTEETLNEISAKIEKEKQRKAKLEQSTNKSSGVTQSTSEASVQTTVSKPATSDPEQSSPQKQGATTTGANNSTISLNINVNIQSANPDVVDQSTVQSEKNVGDQSTSDQGEPLPKVSKVETVIPDSTEPMEVEQAESHEVVMETEDISGTKTETAVEETGGEVR